MTASAEYRPASLKRWRPKEWTPIYEQIVILSAMGHSNKQLAEAFHYSPQQISNIVCTPEAKLTRRRVLESLQQKAEDGIPTRLSALADKATQRVAQVLYDDALFERSPFAVVDRGLSLLRGVGKLKTAAEADQPGNQQNILILTGEDATDIRDGLKKAKEARERHPAEIPVETTGRELKAG